MEESYDYQQDFDRVFSAYQEKKIAVYGTGQNARLIADHVSGYGIVGFISRDGTEGVLSGKRILRIEEAVEIADIIIIAATISSTNIIYSRIKRLVPSAMKILNLYGEILNKEEAYQENPYWEKNYGKLCLEIDRHAVISFDIFDTLIMRTVLKPDDIFEMTEYSGIEKVFGKQFKKYRLEAEKRCMLRKCAPSITDIYECLEEEYLLDKGVLQKLKDWEVLQEKECVLPRNAMINAYHYALSCGKKVYFTSDMYFSADQIRELLEQCGIQEDYELLVSCEFHCSKQDGALYGKLKELAEENNILHIGDNHEIDGIMAEKWGIDSFTVLSAYDLLAASSFVNIFDCIQTKDDKNFLGYFVSRMLNNPFVLSEHKGKIGLTTYQDLALIIYPMTMMFMYYIIENAKRYDCVLFPSRDGYFLYQIYMQIKNTEKGCSLPDAKYIYASRMALSRAAVKDETSFIVLLNKLFSDQTLNCREFIQNQFDIELSDEYDASSGSLMEKWGKEGFIRRLKRHCHEIIEKLKPHRRTYLEYLNSLGLKKYHSIAMVDIVSYGTQIYCLSEILDQKLDMMALGTTDIPNAYIDNAERVFSIYGNVNKKADGAIYSCSSLSVLHLFLELLYSSTDGQFTGISEKQKPNFQSQTEYRKDLVTGVQRELKKIVKRAIETGFYYENISKEFSMGMMQLLFHEYSDMDKELQKQFVFSDPYMGGMKTINLAKML